MTMCAQHTVTTCTPCPRVCLHARWVAGNRGVLLLLGVFVQLPPSITPDMHNQQQQPS
jgi:hypothetical protein